MNPSLRGHLLNLGCAALLLVLAWPPAVRAEVTNAVAAARAQLDRGLIADDAAAIDRAADAFRQLVGQNPGHPLLLAYYGSAVALQAKHAFAPWNKMRYAEDGLDALDKALALVTPEDENRVYAGMPVALVTRLVAISTFVGVPGMFHRLDDARELLQQVYRSPSYRAATAAQQAAFAYQAARIAARDGRHDAEVEQLRKVLALGPQTDDAPKATARLQELAR